MFDRTDEETGELVRLWLQRYGFAVLAGIVLAIALVGGYEWWKSHQHIEVSEASAQLMTLSDAVAKGQTEQAKTLYGKIEEDNSLKPMAALLLAAAYNNDAKPVQALPYLDVAAQGKDEMVAQTAQWQLAQMHIAAGEIEAAEKSLQALKGSIYEPQLALMHAIIAQQQGDNQAALDNYEQALNSLPGKSPLIQGQIIALKGKIVVDSKRKED